MRNVERLLRQLPESLDATYERILRGINNSNREDAYRLLQCLVVSMRPLRVEELAEVLAVDFDSDEDIPKLKPDWRWEDQEQALQAACSSLIAIVDTGRSRVVQFSHFSVKEFLTSPRLADSSGDASRYHVSLGPAHTILAQTCIGVLLRLDDRVDEHSRRTNFPLAEYAAEHWVKHAQFEKVSSRIQKGMENLFNPDRPHFAAWRILHDVDTEPSYESTFFIFGPVEDWDPTPLYYAALCGFHDLAEHLIVHHPQYVNARGGRYYITPLVSALAGNYFQIAQLLLQHGADVDVRGAWGWTPLLSASLRGNTQVVEWLLNHGADAIARLSNGLTPLHLAASRGHLQVARILLEHKADINAQTLEGHTPLHQASLSGSLDVAELLLGLVGHGVDVNARDNAHSTPLHLASGKEGTRLGQFLRHLGQLEPQLMEQLGPQLMEQLGPQLMEQLGPQLIEQLGPRIMEQLGPQLMEQLRPQLMEQLGPQFMEQLEQLRQQVGPQLRRQQLRQQLGSQFRQQLGSQLEQQLGPLLRQLQPQLRQQLGPQLRQLRPQLRELRPLWCPSREVACLLLKHGADVEAKDDEGRTAFHFASSEGHQDIAKLLSEYGAK